MTTIEDIKTAIERLPQHEQVALRAWYEEFDAQAWEEQFEVDVAAGRLDALADQALRAFRSGECTEL